MFKYIVCSIVLIFSLIVGGGIAMNSAISAELPQPPVGWHSANPTAKELSHLKILSVRGDFGGEVALVCNKKTQRINLTYILAGKQYDFFLIRNYGDITKDPSTKLLAGAGMLNQSDVFWHLMRDDSGFTVTRFPIGSKKKWENSIDLETKTGKEVKGPGLQQEGEEFFITGPQTKDLLKKIGESCPLVPEDNRPVI